MARVNFRDIRERFTHIDARFVSCELGFDGVTPRYSVSMYPWWEHPAYIEARNAGKSWGFADCEGGYKEVVVFPQGLIEFRMSRCSDVIDWAFYEDHPLLWPYEDSDQVFCNSDPPLGELVERVRKAIPHVPKADIYSYLDPRLPYKAPFCLGSFPFTLFAVVENELSDLGVATFISRRPEARTMPILFLIGGTDYIIADDFVVDVPDFEHRPEWFKPAKG